MILSPSQIESFDPTTPFGCERRWWFKHVAKMKEPPTAAQTNGTATHAVLEAYLKTGDVAHLGERELPARPYLDQMRSRMLATEYPFSQAWRQHTVRGVIDLYLGEFLGDGEHRTWVHDHKTTSNLKYMKTNEELKRSTQMAIYAWALDIHAPVFSQLFIQTKGAARAAFLTVELDEREQTENLNNIDDLICRMEKASTAKVEDLAPSLDKCDNPGRECPFRFHCPRSNNPMSLLNSLLGVPAPKKLVIQDEPLSVLSPDAPKSDPAKAAVPFEAVPAPKSSAAPPDATPTAPEAPIQAEAPKKKGRPPGAKNKPKPPTPSEIVTKLTESLPPPVFVGTTNEVVMGPAHNPPPGGFTVRNVSVRHTTKLGLPGYSSHEFSIEMNADIHDGTEEQEVIDTLSASILDRLREEMAPLAAAGKAVP